MRIDDAKRILEQFIKGERNSVGDQWGHDMALDAYASLTAELEALRRDAGLWRARVAGSSDASHQCTRCWLSYTPKADESEDCPACGYDGIGPLDAARQQEGKDEG